MNVASEKHFRQGCTRVQYPIWLRGRVHISINVFCREPAKLAVQFAINVIIWAFSILSRIPIVGVGYYMKSFFSSPLAISPIVTDLSLFHNSNLVSQSFLLLDSLTVSIKYLLFLPDSVH